MKEKLLTDKKNVISANLQNFYQLKKNSKLLIEKKVIETRLILII